MITYRQCSVKVNNQVSKYFNQTKLPVSIWFKPVKKLICKLNEFPGYLGDILKRILLYLFAKKLFSPVWFEKLATFKSNVLSIVICILVIDSTHAVSYMCS